MNRKKQIFGILATLSLFITVGVASTYGQLTSVSHFSIPFDFKVGKTALPAGEYSVNLDYNGAVSQLMIRREDGSAAALVLTTPVHASARPDQTKLIFNRYGDQYFLSQAWMIGDDVGRELSPSRVELELAKSAPKPKPETLIGRRR